MVIARELSRPIQLLVAAQPTRVLMLVRLNLFISKLLPSEMREWRAISQPELDEILALSDRIVVMYEAIIGEVNGKDATRQQLGLLMAGVKSTLSEGLIDKLQVL